MDMYQCYSIDHMSFFLNVREMKVYIFFLPLDFYVSRDI